MEDRIYNQRDMDKTLVLNQSTRLVAKVDARMAPCDQLAAAAVHDLDL